MKRWLYAACIVVLLFGAWAVVRDSVSAQDPARVTTIIVQYTEYEWWLLGWDSSQILCQIKVDHEGLPLGEEVQEACGEELAYQWQTTPPCADINTCKGLYVHFAQSGPNEREVVIELPAPTVGVQLEECDPIPPENLCRELPVLVLRGDEPLPNEKITSIEGIFDDSAFECPGEICQFPLRTTPLQGVLLEFWANSSYGDSSEVFTAQVRVVDTGVSAVPGGGGWYIDIISPQWQGEPLSSCGRIWEAFPPIGSPPGWLTTPERHELMASEEPYFYLAGRLIAQGLVDATDCPTGGLLPNGYADACGLEKARPLVEEWQNQFDARIADVASETGIPAQIMKNLFAQESQFWPGVFRVPFEYGLGQMTDNGADSVLLWNPTFFAQFCPFVLAQDACDGGYLSLSEEDQGIMRGALAIQAKSDCPDCPTGVDLTDAEDSVWLFANTLQANCAQVSRTIYTATDQMAGSVSSYEDLWRFTIANYHAGPGCVSYAIHQAWQSTGRLTWDETSTRFTEPCQGAVPYVEKIAQ